MVVLIAGASHTGKTKLAQNLLEKYGYPYLSLDHLKMGLIRSGQTALTPEDGDKLTAYLWPVAREIAKTAIENKQNLIIEGCYIPYDWQKDFGREYLSEMRYVCLVMSENYIRRHFSSIKRYANVIETRLDDTYCTVETLTAENRAALRQCRLHHQNYILIDTDYAVDVAL